jgi:magnesium-transporting ATPase (P-type)
MITGDHPATAQAIARELKIFEPGDRLLAQAQLVEGGAIFQLPINAGSKLRQLPY